MSHEASQPHKARFHCVVRYAQSKKSNLSVQVDAAINSGNRCCPVL